jgi:hypothetical protein
MNEEIYVKRFGKQQEAGGAYIEYTVQLERFGMDQMIRRALHNKSGKSRLGPLEVTAIRLTADQAKQLDITR